jgi:hypothetical protein
MANWDKKYFVTELKERPIQSPWTPTFSEDEARMLYCLDSNVLKGAFYMDTAWIMPGKWTETKGEEGTVKAHTHDFDEVLAYVGTDPDDRYNLNGEIELWIDGKKNVIDKSFLAFIPAGIEHCPLTILRCDKPIFHFTAGMGHEYNR